MIKDNPPPIPVPRWYVRNGCVSSVPDGFPVYSREQYIEGEAAAFDRGLAAGQAEIERLKEKARLSETECRKALDDRRQAFAMRDELRAKLKVLEEQKPVATKIKWFDLATRKETVKIVEHVDSNLPIGTVFYLAAGAKHD